MPEGPEVRRAADRLARVLVDRPLAEVWFRFPRLQRHAAELCAQSILAVRSRGKALLVDFADGRTLYTHNQLYGRWYVQRAGARPSTGRELRLVLETETHAALLYSASEIDLLEPGQWRTHPFLGRLGPDVFDAATTPAFLRRRLRSAAFARRSLGGLLMDQACDLDDETLGALSRAIRALAFRAYRTRGETATKAWVRARKAAGHPRRASRHWVFEREEEPCPRCGSTILRREVASRRLYLCPRCQPAPARKEHVA